MTNLITYDLKTHNTDRARPFVLCFHRLGTLAGKHNRDLTPYELEKSKKDPLVFDGDDCATNVLYVCIKMKGERKVKNKNVEYNLQLHAHIGCGFDTWIVLIKLPRDKHIVNRNKNGNKQKKGKYLMVILKKK